MEEELSTLATPETRKRNALTISLAGTRQGLGIRIVGGRNIHSNESNFGIFIKAILEGQLAEKDGKLLAGDQLLQANGMSLVGVSNEKAVDILRTCAATDTIDLLVARDQTAQSEFMRLSTSLSLPAPRPVTQVFVPVQQEDTRMTSNATSTNGAPNFDKDSEKSSDLTDISETSVSTQQSGDFLEKEEIGDVNLSDVRLSDIGGQKLTEINTNTPPPLPTSPPPLEDEDNTSDEDDDVVNSPLKRLPSPVETAMAFAGGEIALAVLKRREKIESPLKTESPILSTTVPSMTTESIHDTPTLPAHIKPKHVMSIGSNSPSIKHNTGDTPEVYFKQTGKGRIDTERKVTPKDIAKLSGQPVRQRGYKIDPSHQQLHKRFSVEPHKKFKIEKLILVLHYIGHKLSEEQRAQLYKNIKIDDDGKVIFSEFVDKVREMFSFHLEDSQLEDGLVAAHTQRMPTMDLPSITPRSATPSSIDYLLRPSPPISVTTTMSSLAPSIPVTGDEVKYEEMRKQLHSLGQSHELEQLERKRRLREETNDAALKFTQLRDIVEQQSKEKQELQNSIHNLQEKQRHLEAELLMAKKQQENLTNSEMLRRLATKDCEIKKSAAINRRYQTANEILIKFVEDCHDALTKCGTNTLYHPQGKGVSVFRGDQITGNPRPPPYLSQHARKTVSTLAQEAKERVAEVRRILSVDVLPYGWDEEYTEDGRKFFVNHQQQCTSWVHPTTKMPPSSNSPSRISSQYTLTGHVNVP